MNGQNNKGVQQRLIDAAMQCFLDDDYHRVTTRQIAAAADTNVSMIRYYFGNKEGLYEEMIRSTLQPLLDVLESSLLSTTEGFADYFRIYYRTMRENPRFPALVLKVLALNQGPGKRFIHQLLERGRQRGREKIETLKLHGLVGPDVDADAVRITFVSLAMMPMLIKPVFEKQMGREMDEEFLEQLATFSGRLFSSGLLPGKEG
ncbi:MAG: TetR/AcrR family transcriptional regulator [Gammaproteobacteria bacterium]|nr:TetR/AcrR family transcriptional regulator [Gammaproteobacteria bacterium]